MPDLRPQHAYVWASKKVDAEGNKIGGSFNTQPMPLDEAYAYAVSLLKGDDRETIRVYRAKATGNFLTDDLLAEMVNGSVKKVLDARVSRGHSRLGTPFVGGDLAEARRIERLKQRAERAEAPPRPRPLPDPEGGQMYG